MFLGQSNQTVEICNLKQRLPWFDTQPIHKPLTVNHTHFLKCRNKRVSEAFCKLINPSLESLTRVPKRPRSPA